jgi:hypothetical protein
MFMSEESKNRLVCPHCGHVIYIAGFVQEVFLVPEDNERCTALSPTYKLRCQYPKGHKGDHGSWPWNWQ